MKVVDRDALKYWEQYRKNILASTSIDLNETPDEKEKRMKRLKDNPVEWCKYYFPKYTTAEFAPFHIKAINRWIKNDRWYEVRAWSRELAKSTIAMMEDMYLMLNEKAKNKLLISSSYDAAERLLKPYKINLEVNQRIINDYGKQINIGSWEDGDFTSRMGFSFMAVGAGQSPRGNRKEEVRPDILDFDDIDTDEEVLNPAIIKKKWNWIEQAAIPTVSVSGNIRIRFNGNIIAKDTCITRAIEKADHHEIINIRDKNGKSTWKKNSEAHIDWLLKKISYFSAQKEYFNNPISEGTVFTEMHYKKLPPLDKYKFLICYIDLSYKPGKKNDYKAATLLGKYKYEYHIRKAFLRQCTTRELVLGLIAIKNFVAGKTNIYFYAEEVFISDIFIKEMNDMCRKYKVQITIIGDTRKKPDKFHRIESNLEPVNTNGELYLDEDEKDNPDMKVLDEQFRAIEKGSSAHDDGPDSVEGGKYIIDEKEMVQQPVTIGKRTRNNSKRI